MSDVTWRKIDSLPGYEVSSDGRVRSVDRWVVDGSKRATRFRRGKELVTTPSTGGYMRLQVQFERKRINVSVHRLMCEAFHGQPPGEGMQVRHLNGNKLDNRPENLAWGTASENILDNVRHGTHMNAAKTECGQGHPYDEANTYITAAGTRDCRACGREKARLKRACASQRMQIDTVLIDACRD